MLSRIAKALGRPAESRSFAALAEDTRQKIRTCLWDAERSIYANRHRQGGFVRSVGPTSFYPLICGAATPEQAGALVRELFNPERFGGTYMVPNVSRDDPAFADNVLARAHLAKRELFPVARAAPLWLHTGSIPSGHGQHAAVQPVLDQAPYCGRKLFRSNGEADDQPDTDLFLSWGRCFPCLVLRMSWTSTHGTGGKSTIRANRSVSGRSSPLSARSA
ncbi:trehalase family glycosidase [Komagataeibacter rhaeticus]|nr:trehalase family glycosidase [Komagataeibacter rhaeticus]